MVNAAPTAGEGDRLARCISALVNAGITLDMYIGTTAGTLDRARTATN